MRFTVFLSRTCVVVSLNLQCISYVESGQNEALLCCALHARQIIDLLIYIVRVVSGLTQFRWLIRCCRRFVRTLHQQAALHRRGYQCTRLRQRHQRVTSWRRWRAQYAKRATTSALCDRIYAVKLGRLVLRMWRVQAIERLLPAVTATAALVQRNTAKHVFALWRGLQSQRRYQAQINAVLRTGRKRRILGQWRTYIGLLKQSRRIYTAMMKRVLKPLWRTWRRKVSGCLITLFALFLLRWTGVL